mmetsp:Transcript_102307/g.257715  ORF Transcript_102307/g.257715 Transcript_102307/m.257715 type:complete len:94 (+) Transcript_102307:845-1126(+)
MLSTVFASIPCLPIELLASEPCFALGLGPNAQLQLSDIGDRCAVRHRRVSRFRSIQSQSGKLHLSVYSSAQDYRFSLLGFPGIAAAAFPECFR